MRFGHKKALVCISGFAFISLISFSQFFVSTNPLTSSTNLNKENAAKPLVGASGIDPVEYNTCALSAMSARDKVIDGEENPTTRTLARLESPTLAGITYPVSVSEIDNIYGWSAFDPSQKELKFRNCSETLEDYILYKQLSQIKPGSVQWQGDPTSIAKPITMIDFNNDSLVPTNLKKPGFYRDTTDFLKETDNNLRGITKVIVTDGAEDKENFHNYTSDKTEFTSALTEIGYFCFSGLARIFNTSSFKFHDYYTDTNFYKTPAPAFANLESVVFKDVDEYLIGHQGDPAYKIRAKVSLKVIHSGAFSDATKLETVDFGSSNQIAYIDEMGWPSLAQTEDYKKDPENTPRPYISEDGADYSGTVGIFENDVKLSKVNLYQQHYGLYNTDPNKPQYHSYLKTIPGNFLKNCKSLTSFNADGPDDAKNAIYIPNSVTSIGKEAFSGINSGITKVYFPEPNLDENQYGVASCASDIFGYSPSPITDIYLPELNPSSNFLLGLVNSVDNAYNPDKSHQLTFHVPYNFNEKLEVDKKGLPEYTAADSIYAKYLRNSILKTNISFEFSSPKSFVITEPKSGIKKIYGNAAKDTSAKNYVYFNNFDGKWTDDKASKYAWEISTTPKNSKFTNEQFYQQFSAEGPSSIDINIDPNANKNDYYVSKTGRFYYCPSYYVKNNITSANISLNFKAPAINGNRSTTTFKIPVWADDPSKTTIQYLQYGETSTTTTPTVSSIVKKISSNTSFTSKFDKVIFNPNYPTAVLDKVTSDDLLATFSVTPVATYLSAKNVEVPLTYSSSIDGKTTTYNFYPVEDQNSVIFTATVKFVDEVPGEPSTTPARFECEVFPSASCSFANACGKYTVKFVLKNNITLTEKASAPYTMQFWQRTGIYTSNTNKPNNSVSITPYIGVSGGGAFTSANKSAAVTDTYHYAYVNDFYPDFPTNFPNTNVVPTNTPTFTPPSEQKWKPDSASNYSTLNTSIATDPTKDEFTVTFTCVINNVADAPTGNNPPKIFENLNVIIQDQGDTNVKTTISFKVSISGYTENWSVKNDDTKNLGIFSSSVGTYKTSSYSFPLISTPLPATGGADSIGQINFKLEDEFTTDGDWSVSSEDNAVSKDDLTKVFGITSEFGTTPNNYCWVTISVRLNCGLYIKNPGNHEFKVIFTPKETNKETHAAHFWLNCFKISTPTITMVTHPDIANPKNIYIEPGTDLVTGNEKIKVAQFILTPNFIDSVVPNASNYSFDPVCTFTSTESNKWSKICKIERTANSSNRYDVVIDATEFKGNETIPTVTSNSFSFNINSLEYSDDTVFTKTNSHSVTIPVPSSYGFSSSSVNINNVNIIQNKASAHPSAINFINPPSKKYITSIKKDGKFSSPFSINAPNMNISDKPDFLNQDDAKFDTDFTYHYTIIGLQKKSAADPSEWDSVSKDLFKITNKGLVYWNSEDWDADTDNGEYRFGIGMYIDVKNSAYSSSPSSHLVAYASSDNEAYSFNTSEKTWSLKEGKTPDCDVIVTSSSSSFSYNLKDEKDRGDYFIDKNENINLVFCPSDERTITFELNIPHNFNNQNFFENDTKYTAKINDTNVLKYVDEIPVPSASDLIPPTSGHDGKVSFTLKFKIPKTPPSPAFSFSIDFYVEHGGLNLLVFTSPIIKCFISKIDSISVSFYYNDDGKKVAIKNGQSIDVSLANAVDSFIFPEYTFKTTYTPIDKTSNEAVWLLWFNRLEYSSINKVSLNGNIVANDFLPEWFQIGVSQYNIHDNQITDAEKFGQPLHLKTEPVSKHPEFSKYFGTYTINTTTKFDSSQWYKGDSSFEFNFGIVCSLHPVVVSHTGEVIGIIVGVIAAIAVVIILLKIMSAKAKARKILKEEEEEEKTSSGSSGPVSAKFGVIEKVKESATGF